MPINQPSNQIKLTNVSIVRLKKAGKRFEIACYKNKVGEWRSKHYIREQDLDNVVQISSIFTNVSKGQVCSNDELQKAFGTIDNEQIIKQILQKGELQVGEKERGHALSNTWREIATLVSEKCVDPNSGRPITVNMIEKAMHDVHYSVNANKNAKSQTSEVIKLIQEKGVLPISRAQMRIRITCPSKQGKDIKDKVKEVINKVEDEDWSDEWELIGLIDPSTFKTLNEMKLNARIEVMENSVKG